MSSVERSAERYETFLDKYNMERDLRALTRTEYDLLVVGGGIHGACIARDAALRGLQVALVEQSDFGQAASANSLKILHGGLRYLQSGNLRLARTMIRERRTWQYIAPHLVQPLPCLLPTGFHLKRSRSTLSLALMLNDLLGADRNRGLLPQQCLPPSCLLGRTECLSLLPGLDPTDVTGAALWHDAQIIDSERLLLAILHSAVDAGATIVNYMTVTELMQQNNVVMGAVAWDELAQEERAIRAQLVVNCTGGWTDVLLQKVRRAAMPPRFPQSVAMNLVTRQIASRYAFGASNHPADPQSQTFFIVPWQGYSMIGTLHLPYDGEPDCFAVDDDVVQDFLQQINRAYPGAALTRDDVRHVQWGFLPQRSASQAAANNRVQLLRAGQIYNHAQSDGVHGLLSVVGVKYTTARHVAERAVDLVVRLLGCATAPCQTATTRLSDDAIDTDAIRHTVMNQEIEHTHVSNQHSATFVH